MPAMTKVTIIGVAAKPSSVMFNQKAVSDFTYSDTVQSLMVTISASMKENFKLEWK